MPIKTLCPNCHSSNVYKLGNDNINFSLPLNQTLLHPRIIEGLSSSICNAYRLPPYAGIAISTVANIAISLVQTKFTIFFQVHSKCNALTVNTSLMQQP